MNDRFISFEKIFNVRDISLAKEEYPNAAYL